MADALNPIYERIPMRISQTGYVFGFFYALLMHPVLAQGAYPVPRNGFCPSGYRASGNYCVPNGPQSGYAIEKERFCPSGYHASGNYCLANSQDSGRAILKNGFCPSGYHASGSYCVEN